MDAGDTAESQIAKWSEKRPSWQQAVLRRLATGETLTKDDLETTADNLIAGRSETVAPLTETEISAAATDTSTITLESVGDITNINGLIEGETLTFDNSALTVVYGHNASGKSGYARLIKDISGALHEEPIHGNVFTDNGDNQQAEIVYHRDGTSETSTWPDNVDGDLRTIRFYDEACGNRYIDRKSELTYRPSALTLLDGLIETCDAVSSVLDRRLTVNEEERGKLPKPPEDSDAATFLDTITSATTKKQIDDASQLPTDVDDQRTELSQREARLRGSDPATERARIGTLADKAETVSQHIEMLTDELSDDAYTAAIMARDKALDLRATAILASSQQFSNEPLPGVGTDTWRALWQAARRFSETEAYHEHEFPVAGNDARCVLCHQKLSDDATDRLTRFEQFVQDETERQAANAETAFETILKNLEDLVIKRTEIAENLVTLEGDKPRLAKDATKWLRTAENRRKAIVAKLIGKADGEPAAPVTDPRDKLDVYVKEQRDTAAKIDDAQFEEDLATVTGERANLDGRIALNLKKSLIVAEVERLRKRTAIVTANHATDTAQISRKTSDIMKQAVTGDVLERFRAEAEGMHLDQVELTTTGSTKGRFQQRPALAGTDTNTPVREVLSEGEQTALGLAGFFTEAHFDTSRSTLVLDDPVTSLDHIRREHVAERIVEFAGQRQVIVFTHELVFVAELSQAAEEADLNVTERRIERVGKSPGKVGDAYPWNAQGVKQRLGTLRQDLDQIKKRRDSWSDWEYEEACAKWAGDLSETWERLVHLEVVGQVFNTAKYEVRPKMFRILAKITPEDDRQFQKSYGKCSKWARRHDKSPEFIYTAPELDALEEQYELVREWHGRVKRYRNS